MRKRAELLQEALRLAFDASPAAMLMVDPEGRIGLVNAPCEQMFGYARGQMIGMSVEELAPISARPRHAAPRAGFAAKPEKRLMGVGRDLRARRADGAEFPVEIGLTPVTTPLGPRVLVFAVDISVRLDAEKAMRRALGELERANEGLTRFAYVASHDIQEPLRKIASFAEILTTGLRNDNFEEARHAAEVMAAAAKRARRLVADLLALARSLNDAYAPETISAREIVDQALDNLSQTIIDEGAAVTCFGDDFSIRGDRTQAVELIQNIVSNAVKFHKPGRPPTVRVRLDGQADGGPRASIEDEGVGFAAMHREEIFEPFRRLRGQGDVPGSGIGLAICKTIADRHGWRLSAQSTPMIGSTFEIVFATAAG